MPSVSLTAPEGMCTLTGKQTRVSVSRLRYEVPNLQKVEGMIPPQDGAL